MCIRDRPRRAFLITRKLLIVNDIRRISSSYVPHFRLICQAFLGQTGHLPPTETAYPAAETGRRGFAGVEIYGKCGKKGSFLLTTRRNSVIYCLSVCQLRSESESQLVDSRVQRQQVPALCKLDNVFETNLNPYRLRRVGVFFTFLLFFSGKIESDRRVAVSYI